MRNKMSIDRYLKITNRVWWEAMWLQFTYYPGPTHMHLFWLFIDAI